MGARRVLAEGVAYEEAPPEAIYRPFPKASRAQFMTYDDFDPMPAQPSRRMMMLDDTTTIRPGWETLTIPVDTAVITTKYIGIPTPPRRRRTGLVVAVVLVALAMVLAGIGLLMPNTHKPTVDAPVPVQARMETGTGANSGLAQGVNNASVLSPSDNSAAAALAADAQVKAEIATAAQLSKVAGQAALAKAVAEFELKQKNAGSAMPADGVGPAPDVENGQFVFPVKNFNISSSFGWRTDPVYGGAEFHSGLDLVVPCGTPIHASGDGVVSFAGWNSGLGNYVEINHTILSTGYGHQEKIVVHAGQLVKQGDLIGYVGSTGKSTGCHVHFQAMNAKGQYFDPSVIIH